MLPANKLIVSVAFLLIASIATVAQVPKTDVAVFELGDQVTRIPAPQGFEEAAAQFEKIRNHFNATEAPDNDMLAVHLSHADCDKLRAGGFGPFTFYTKVSVRKGVRTLNYSAERFAALVAEFRKNGANYLDVDSPAMRATLERLGKGVSELNKQETEIDLSQPTNLGEFDARPNVYSVMLLMPFKSQTAENERTVLIAAGMSFVRVKQRLIYVYTYRKYESKSDVEVLRDFTKQWVSQILAAN